MSQTDISDSDVPWVLCEQTDISDSDVPWVLCEQIDYCRKCFLKAKDRTCNGTKTPRQTKSYAKHSMVCHAPKWSIWTRASCPATDYWTRWIFLTICTSTTDPTDEPSLPWGIWLLDFWIPWSCPRSANPRNRARNSVHQTRRRGLFHRAGSYNGPAASS